MANQMLIKGSFLAVSISLVLATVAVEAKDVMIHNSSTAITGSSSATGAYMPDKILSGLQEGSHSIARDATLNSAEVAGSISTGRDLRSNGSQIQGSVSIGRDGMFNNNKPIHSVTSGRDLVLNHTFAIGSIVSGRNMTLHHAEVDGNVTVGGRPTVQNSTIKGNLAVATDHLVLENSKVGHIEVKEASANSDGSNVSISGSRVTVQNGKTNISVGSGSNANFSGYTIKGMDSQTTVIVPDGSVYVNGSLVSGYAPATYAQYLEATPNAPHIDGPGWDPNGGSVSPASADGELAQPVQIVELKGNSEITTGVTFESGHGKVLVPEGAIFLGQVVGGVVEKQ